MLYPFWVWLWARGWTVIGMPATDWLAYIRQSQALNAIAAATAIGLLFSVLESVAGTGIALLGALQFGLSTAVMLHATNSAEPVMGLLFSMAALRVLFSALRSGSQAGLLLVGLFLALALASYQAMALIAPAVGFACVCWPGAAGDTRTRLALSRLALVGIGGLVSVAAIYGLAYSALGVPIGKMLARFLQLDGDAAVYGGVGISKLINAPFGLIRNLYGGVPLDYGGIRSLAGHPDRAFWIPYAVVSFILLAIFAWLVGAGIASGVRRWEAPKSWVWSGILISVSAVAFPLVFWGSTYDKLWLLPLALFTLAGAFAFRFGGFSPSRRRGFVIGLGVLVMAEAAMNLPHAIRDHIRETAHLSEARDLAALATAQDSMVMDFDDVGILWLSIWGDSADHLVLPAVKRRDAIEWLARADQNDARRHGKLLLVGVLDQDEKSWDAFVGRATGIGFAEFDCYRREAKIVRRYPFPDRPLTVRQLDAGVQCSSSLGTAGR